MNISLIQSNIVWENKTANYQKTDELVASISIDTDLIILPEMFNTGFSMQPEKLAEQAESESLKYLRKWTKSKNVAIITSFIVEENGKYYNRAFFVNPDGTYQTYNKRHLFRMAGEDRFYSMGDSRTIVNYKGFRIMLQICYDLRFPVWSRNKNDYDLIVYIANWPESRKDAWETLLKARAIENQCYVAGVNRVGIDGKGHNHSGNSALINFKGEVLSKFTPNQEDALTYTINKKEINLFRERFPAYLDADNFEMGQ